jgi:hypothetical protein
MISALPYAMKYCQSLQFYLKAYENEWKKPKQFFEKILKQQAEALVGNTK